MQKHVQYEVMDFLVPFQKGRTEKIGKMLNFYIKHPIIGGTLRKKITAEYRDARGRIMQEIDLASFVASNDEIKILENYLKNFDYKIGSRVMEHIV